MAFAYVRDLRALGFLRVRWERFEMRGLVSRSLGNLRGGVRRVGGVVRGFVVERGVKRLRLLALVAALCLMSGAAAAEYIIPPGLPFSGGTLSGPLNANGGINTTSSAGYEWNGWTLLNAYGNSGNVFSDGAGTDTLVGLGAGAALPTADYLTTAVGWHALHASTSTNTESTAVGWNAQGSITTGNQNTTVGINTLGSCLTCVHDILIGTDSMRNSTTASDNIGIGVTTLINDGSTGYNIAIGDAALQSNSGSTGIFNIAIGWNSVTGASMTTATQNTFIGAAVAQNLTSASNNECIGHVACGALTTGNFNVVYGEDAGAQITTGYNNTIIGSQVASTTLSTGFGNILIGYNNSTDAKAAGTTFELNIGNVIVGGMSTPTVSSCGSGVTAPNTGSSDLNGSVTVGASVTSCTVTFALAASTRRTCVVTDRSGFAPGYTPGLTTLVVTNSGLAGTTFDYVCNGI